MPDLPEDLEWVKRAYADLSGSRHAAGGSIPFEAADRYAERSGVQDFDRFWTLLRAMDARYHKHLRRERGSGD